MINHKGNHKERVSNQSKRLLWVLKRNKETSQGDVSSEHPNHTSKLVDEKKKIILHFKKRLPVSVPMYKDCIYLLWRIILSQKNYSAIVYNEVSLTSRKPVFGVTVKHLYLAGIFTWRYWR